MVEGRLRAAWWPFDWIMRRLVGGQSFNPYVRRKRRTLSKKETVHCLALMIEANKRG